MENRDRRAELGTRMMNSWILVDGGEREGNFSMP
jgi:hypothetical protein